MAAFKQHIFPVVAGGLLVVTSIVGGVTVAGQNAQLDEQKAKISSLEQQFEQAQTITSDAEAAASMLATGGDVARVKADRQPIEDLVELALTWDSDKAYGLARAEMMSRYGLAEDSAFMVSFLPPAPFNTDSQGNIYPYIDAAGLNSRVGDVKYRLLSIAGTEYRYMVTAAVQSTSDDGEVTASNIATILLTIDGDGVITELSGFAATEAPRSSG